jgi:hypothetical protein
MPFRCGALGREASAGDARLLRVALEFLDDKLVQLFIAELRHLSLVRKALWRPVDVPRERSERSERRELRDGATDPSSAGQSQRSEDRLT